MVLLFIAVEFAPDVAYFPPEITALGGGCTALYAAVLVTDVDAERRVATLAEQGIVGDQRHIRLGQPVRGARPGGVARKAAFQGRCDIKRAEIITGIQVTAAEIFVISRHIVETAVVGNACEVAVIPVEIGFQRTAEHPAVFQVTELDQPPHAVIDVPALQPVGFENDVFRRFALGVRGGGVAEIRSGQAVGISRIEDGRRTDLLEVAEAFGAFRPVARFGQRGQQHRGKDGDNGDHDQQFYQRKWFSANGFHIAPPVNGIPVTLLRLVSL
ncbi:hypothetical protein SDC9_120041 [bioreactor metagenome]|uniref:Uncharacterized protein n=1 Tax=bioreactor metagenome TaxID=1076179 RepID=A0A645C677_9ZZZZ